MPRPPVLCFRNRHCPHRQNLRHHLHQSHHLLHRQNLRHPPPQSHPLPPRQNPRHPHRNPHRLRRRSHRLRRPHRHHPAAAHPLRVRLLLCPVHNPGNRLLPHPAHRLPRDSYPVPGEVRNS